MINEYTQILKEKLKESYEKSEKIGFQNKGLLYLIMMNYEKVENPRAVQQSSLKKMQTPTKPVLKSSNIVKYETFRQSESIKTPI